MRRMLTFVNIFPGCSQDSFAVLAVTADVIKQLKTKIYYRQDNAGCCHCGAAIAIIVDKSIGTQQHILHLPYFLD